MKTNAFIFMWTVLIATAVSSSAYSEDVDPAQLTEAIKNVTGLEKKLDGTGVISADCSGCKTIEPDKKIELKNKVEDLGTPMLYKNNKAYVYHLKRTKDSPLKATLKFKNGHQVCGKMFVGSNPYNGSLIVECMIKITQYEDEELDINLKNLPLPADGEEQIIEIKFSKPEVTTSFYTVETEVLKGPPAKISKDKKFWGYGFNLEYSEKKP